MFWESLFNFRGFLGALGIVWYCAICVQKHLGLESDPPGATHLKYVLLIEENLNNVVWSTTYMPTWAT